MKDIDRIYLAARELPSGDRPAYLAEACGCDHGLRALLERKLALTGEAEAFFAGQPDDEPEGGNPERTRVTARGHDPARAPGEIVGQKIGRYKILEPLGEGGCGVVYVAEQTEPVRRRVALKVIKSGMDTKQVIARFEAERQALAMMDHPNIAKVLDAGATELGRPYFVMELVRGIRITDYCDQANLATRERLDLFIKVCQAIQHAHQKGIIHRDIKPSNILVTLHDGVPVPKVIDFGIAKATEGRLTDATVYTQLHQFIGTPAYMSPEQAEMSGLDIDTRSDIYSLGVLLYELLAGSPPFDGKELMDSGLDAMRKTIREKEPVRPSMRLATLGADQITTTAKRRSAEPSKLLHQLQGDLDWIVMKCLEKDRNRRYETANAFAQDIGRFLADEAVTARPPSAGYQFRKFARRNRAAFRIAALIAVLLVAATAVSGWQAVRATKAEALAKDRLGESEKARADAEAISKFLTGMFESSQPGKEKGGREVKVADVLDIAAKKLETELTDQPERRAVLQTTLGQTCHALGLYPQAIPLQEKARDYYLKTHGPEHPDTLEAMQCLADCYFCTGRKDEALKMQEELLTLSRKVNGPEHPNTLMAITNLAAFYFDAGRKDEVRKMHEELLTLSRKVNGLEHPLTLTAMHNLAISYEGAGRKDEALKRREEVLTLRRKVDGPEHPDTLRAMSNLALSYSDAGRKDEALKMQEEGLALYRKVLGPEDTLRMMYDLAASFSDAGRNDEAIKMGEEALTLFRKVLGPEYPDTLATMDQLARSYSKAGRTDEALKLHEEVLALSRKVNGPEHPLTLTAMAHLANFYAAAGLAALPAADAPAAPPVQAAAPAPTATTLKSLEKALETARKGKGPEAPETIAARTALAAAYGADGSGRKAIKLGEEALALARRVLPAGDTHTIGAMKVLIPLYRSVDLEEDAAKLEAELKALPAPDSAPPRQ